MAVGDKIFLAKKSDVDSIQSQVDELVVKAGDSSAEVLQARVDAGGKKYTTLQQRLNASDALSAQIANQVDLATVDVKTGTSIQSTIADDCIAELKIEGATSITKPNPEADTSPDNVAVITNAKNFEVVSCGKNLIPNNSASKAISGITFTVNSDKSITVSGTATAQATLYLFGDVSTNKTLTLPKGTYVIKGTGIGSASVGYGLYEAVTNTVIVNPKSSDVSFTLTQSTDISRLTFYVGSGVSVNATIYPQIETGTTATAYEPFKSNKITITQELASLPTKDVIEDIGGGKAKWTKRVGKIVFDGSESGWFIANEYTNCVRFATSIPDYKIGSMTVISNKFGFGGFGSDKENISGHTSSSRIDITISRSRILTQNVAGFKSWLAANPVTVQYELATPIETIIDIPPLKTYKGITNIYATANPQPYLTAKFLSRLKNVQETINGMPATNLIMNGDFSNGTSGWSNITAIVNGRASKLASAQYQSIGQSIITTIGNKYYMAIDIEGVPNKTYFKFGTGTDMFPSSTATQRLSKVITAQTASAIFEIGDNRAADWTTYYIDNCILIDLTATFGVGNEPTKDEMDAIMSKFPNSWLNGTINPLLTHKELMTYLNKNKANVKQEDWITPTLTNAYTSVSGHTVKYRKNNFNRLEFTGRLQSGAAGASAFTTITGYRPSTDRLVLVPTGTTTGVVRCILNTAGVFTIEGAYTSFVDLNGVSIDLS